MSLDIFELGLDIFGGGGILASESSTISSDAITITSSAKIVIVALTCAAATDDLKTINGLSNQFVLLVPAAGKTITLNDTDLIELPAGTFILTGNRLWFGFGNGTNVKEVSSAENA